MAETEPGGAPPRADEDPLARLEARLDRASDAAERLIAEAASAAIRRPPPAGWQRPQSEPPDQETASPSEIELLLEAVRDLRDRIPPDLQRRLGEALRELLVALRALIDWYLERSKGAAPEPTDVQDIPIL